MGYRGATVASGCTAGVWTIHGWASDSNQVIQVNYSYANNYAS